MVRVIEKANEVYHIVLNFKNNYYNRIQADSANFPSEVEEDNFWRLLRAYMDLAKMKQEQASLKIKEECPKEDGLLLTYKDLLKYVKAKKDSHRPEEAKDSLPGVEESKTS